MCGPSESLGTCIAPIGACILIAWLLSRTGLQEYTQSRGCSVQCQISVCTAPAGQIALYTHHSDALHRRPARKRQAPAGLQEYECLISLARLVQPADAKQRALTSSSPAGRDRKTKVLSARPLVAKQQQRLYKSARLSLLHAEAAPQTQHCSRHALPSRPRPEGFQRGSRRLAGTPSCLVVWKSSFSCTRAK